MSSIKYKIGDLINLVDERNDYNIKDFFGININKEFMPTAADTQGLDEKKYKVVRKNRFVYSGMQTGRDKCIRISLYMEDKPIIVSPAYTTFEIRNVDVIDPCYFFMIFKSTEKDRLGWFYSDSSIRSNLDWERFCEILIDVPDISVQKKYVNIYEGLLKNCNAYSSGLDDLEMICNGYLDKLKNTAELKKIGEYIELSDLKNNQLKYKEIDVKGISINKNFIETKADMNGVYLKSYFVVKPNYFSYVTVTSRNGGKISIARNTSEQDCICSSSYVVFYINDSSILLPEYLEMWFNRSEFDRYARFNSWGSARETFSWEDMCDVNIPLPDIETQKNLANLYNSYILRKNILNDIKLEMNKICPILIRGSLEAD